MSEERLAGLERRVALLEARGKTTEHSPPSTSLMGVLHEMRHKAEDASTPGTVGYVGAAFLPDGDYLWAREHQLTELLPADWMPAAGILESLGSPPRLTLLGTLVRHGRRTRADLQEALGGDGAETTSGQLYHHLRALQNAGLIVQRRRGEYELAAVAVIPLLTIVATALNLATDPPIGPPIGPPIEE